MKSFASIVALKVVAEFEKATVPASCDGHMTMPDTIAKRRGHDETQLACDR